jgi:Domain of unknown function (DUF6048)
MLKYFYSLLLVISSFVTIAQEAKKDTIVSKTQRYGLRLGVDLSKIARSFYEPNYKGFEIVGDYRLTQKMYIAGELGNENKTIDDDRINFTAKGSYFKVGFDYNAYENWLDMENIIHIGLRFGACTFSQERNTYKIYDTSAYFPQLPSVAEGTQFEGLSAQWAEVVAGIKAEIFNNVYIGFSFRMNYLFANKKPDNFDNLYIPGYNKTYDGKFGAGFNYTVSYFIPLYKTKAKNANTKKQLNLKTQKPNSK